MSTTVKDPINPLTLEFETAVPCMMGTTPECMSDPELIEGPYRVLKSTVEGFLACAFPGAVGWHIKIGDPIVEVTPGKLIVADPARAAFYFPVC